VDLFHNIRKCFNLVFAAKRELEIDICNEKIFTMRSEWKEKRRTLFNFFNQKNRNSLHVGNKEGKERELTREC
jgi:hypothetical protein